MKRKIISCKVYKPYVEVLQEKHDINLDIVWIDIKQHDNPVLLGETIQHEIDQATSYDQIVLLYGLCGNAIVNLKSRGAPLILIRAHDCCSVLLGSKKRHRELFKENFSRPWVCESYEIENREHYSKKSPEYLDFIRLYGQDNADYLISILTYQHNDMPYYITFDSDTDIHYLTKSSQRYHVISGDLSIIESILLGVYDQTNTIVLYENEKIKVLYDLDEVITTEDDN